MMFGSKWEKQGISTYKTQHNYNRNDYCREDPVSFERYPVHLGKPLVIRVHNIYG